MGQILLAKRMGKTRIIAETGGQHAATATVAAMFGFNAWFTWVRTIATGNGQCVPRMLGAEVVPVEGPKDLKEAVNEAMRIATMCAARITS